MNKISCVFIIRMLVGGLALSILSACAYQRPPGQWAVIDTPEIYFSGVELNENAKDSTYPKLCVEAQNEIEIQLAKRFPAQIKPLIFYVSKKHKKTDSKETVFQMTITKCEVDVKQWNGSFTFYLTLNVRASLTSNNETLMNYQMQTYEQLQTDIPNPFFDFSFEEPVARTLILFEKNRAWVPNKN